MNWKELEGLGRSWGLLEPEGSVQFPHRFLASHTLLPPTAISHAVAFSSWAGADALKPMTHEPPAGAPGVGLTPLVHLGLATGDRNPCCLSTHAFVASARTTNVHAVHSPAASHDAWQNLGSA